MVRAVLPQMSAAAACNNASVASRVVHVADSASGEYVQEPDSERARSGKIIKERGITIRANAVR